MWLKVNKPPPCSMSCEACWRSDGRSSVIYVKWLQGVSHMPWTTLNFHQAAGVELSGHRECADRHTELHQFLQLIPMVALCSTGTRGIRSSRVRLHVEHCFFGGFGAVQALCLLWRRWTSAKKKKKMTQQRPSAPLVQQMQGCIHVSPEGCGLQADSSALVPWNTSTLQQVKAQRRALLVEQHWDVTDLCQHVGLGSEKWHLGWINHGPSLSNLMASSSTAGGERGCRLCFKSRKSSLPAEPSVGGRGGHGKGPPSGHPRDALPDRQAGAGEPNVERRAECRCGRWQQGDGQPALPHRRTWCIAHGPSGSGRYSNVRVRLQLGCYGSEGTQRQATAVYLADITMNSGLL